MIITTCFPLDQVLSAQCQLTRSVRWNWRIMLWIICDHDWARRLIVFRYSYWSCNIVPQVEVFLPGQDYLLCQLCFQEFHREILKIQSVHCKVNKVHLQLREYYFAVLTTCKPRVNDSLSTKRKPFNMSDVAAAKDPLAAFFEVSTIVHALNGISITVSWVNNTHTTNE